MESAGRPQMSSGLCRSECLIAKVAETLHVCMFATTVAQLEKISWQIAQIAKVAQTSRLCFAVSISSSKPLKRCARHDCIALRKFMKVACQLSKSPKSNVTPVRVSVISGRGSWSTLGVLSRDSLRTSHCKSRSNVTPVHVSVIRIAIP